MTTALILALAFTAGATALANARRLGDGRVWLAYAAGALIAVFISLVSRPFVQIAGQLGGWDSESIVLYVLSSSVHGAIAEMFKITAALVLLSFPRVAFGGGEGLGAAIGAGAAMTAIAQLLQGALVIASLGLPGGQSLPQGMVTGVALVALSAATTGLGTGLAARGRLFAGIALALILTLAVDPGLRLLTDGTSGSLTRPIVSALLFAWLLWRAWKTPAVAASPAEAPGAIENEPEPTGSGA